MTGQFLYTQEQARSVTGIGQETLRHWRKLVPYLAAKSGKAARFSFGDFVGLAVTREITDRLGISISCVQDGIESLFRVLAQLTAVQPGSIAVLQHCVSSVVISETRLGSLECEPTVLIPLDPVIEDLRAKLLSGLKLPAQSVLPFFAEAVSQ